MRTLNLCAAVAAGGFLIFGAQGAAGAEWRLVEVSGPVRVAAPGREAAVATSGQVLPVGTNVTTGGGGRAALMNGAQRVVVGPNSRMTVAPDSSNAMTRVMQDLGSILFQVDKKPSQHFRVETPLLAAVVKGTTFTVTVGPQSDAVHVAEGLVEVRASNGGAVQDVPAGATGVVSRADPQALSVQTPSSDVSSEPVPAAIEPLDYASASGGLIDAAPAGGDVQGRVGLGDSSASPNAPAEGAVAADGGGLQSARAVAAVMAAAQDNGAGGERGAGPANAPGGPGGGNGGGEGNAGGGNGVPAGPSDGNAGNGNAGNPGAGGSGNQGNGNGNAGDPGNGNSGNGNAGNGNSGNGNPGNGNSGNGNSGNGNSGNGNSGNANPGNGNGNSGNGNSGNGNSGNGNGNDASANPGNGNSGNGNGNSGNGNGASENPGNGNSGAGNGDAGNGNGNGNGGTGADVPGNGNAGGGAETAPGQGAGNPGNGAGQGGGRVR
jgi:hypothetical protein